MLIVAIAWLYVVLLMAFTEPSLIAAAGTFLFYGALPLTIVLYLMGMPQRKRNRQRQEQERKMMTPPENLPAAADNSGIETNRSDHTQ